MSDSDVRPVTNRLERNCLTPQIALNVYIQRRRGQGGHPGLPLTFVKGVFKQSTIVIAVTCGRVH